MSVLETVLGVLAWWSLAGLVVGGGWVWLFRNVRPDDVERVTTTCTNPLSHPVGYGRNGEHL